MRERSRPNEPALSPNSAPQTFWKKGASLSFSGLHRYQGGGCRAAKRNPWLAKVAKRLWNDLALRRGHTTPRMDEGTQVRSPAERTANAKSSRAASHTPSPAVAAASFVGPIHHLAWVRAEWTSSPLVVGLPARAVYSARSFSDLLAGQAGS